MGLPVSVARYCPDESDDSARVFGWSLLYTSASSALATVLLLTLAPRHLLAPVLEHGPVIGAAALALLTVGMSFAVLVEVRLMTLRRWDLVVWRVVAVVVVRMPLLWIVPDEHRALAVLVLAAGSPALSGLIGAIALRRMHGSRVRLRPAPGELTSWLRYSNVNYLGLLGAQGPTFLVPVLVALQTGSAEFAPFYIAWTITTVVFVVPHVIGQTLLAEASKVDANADGQVPIALWLSIGFTGCAAASAWVIGPLLGSMLGEEYSAVATQLPWLLSAAVPWAITSTVLACARVRREGRTVVTVTAVFFAVTLTSVGVATATSGIDGAVRAWFVANVLAAAFALTSLPAPARTIDLTTAGSRT
jgi:O-antigen/teichoic acid export membrane protein